MEDPRMKVRHMQERDGEAARIRRLTCFDSLAGLPNRLLLLEQLDLVLRLAKRQSQTVAELLADVDDFRRIRTSLGHARSNTVIKTLARRIEGCLRHSDLVAGSGAPDGGSNVARAIAR